MTSGLILLSTREIWAKTQQQSFSRLIKQPIWKLPYKALQTLYIIYADGLCLVTSYWRKGIILVAKQSFGQQMLLQIDVIVQYMKALNRLQETANCRKQKKKSCCWLLRVLAHSLLTAGKNEPWKNAYKFKLKPVIFFKSCLKAVIHNHDIIIPYWTLGGL